MKYKRTINLGHNELPATINQDTGEITEIRKKPNNVPDHKEVHMVDGKFTKNYVNSWKFLSRELTHTEMFACTRLILLAKAYTNSLEPLNDETVLRELVSKLGVSKNKMKAVLKKLFILGVYAKFEAVKPHLEYTKYWILNPYLAFNGKLINSDIKDLFRGTQVEMASTDPEFKRIE